MKTIVKTYAGLGALALLGFTGCQASDAGQPGGSGGNPGGTGGKGNAGTGSGGSGNPGSGGDGSAGTSGGSGGSSNLTLACPQPLLGSPVLRALTRNEFQNTLSDIFPEVAGQWTSTLPSNAVSDYGFDNDASATVGTQLAGALVDTAESLATAVVGTPLATLLPCSTASSPGSSCADTFITKYGRRLFRRPLTSDEHTRYLNFFTTSLGKSDFKTALKWTLIGLIQSPNAVYRSEIGATQSDGTRQLSPYEVATALAYTYTGSTPTDALLTTADSGNLGDVAALAKTLAASDQGKQVLQNFFEAYLSYSNVTSIQKPNISTFSNVSADMIQETQAFINDVVFQQGGGMKELLTATTTNPSQALATYYGFPAPSSDYASIARPAGRGIGILAQGSFLATHASSDSSSPTKRGLFPYRQLFCEPKLTPPPNVPQISAPQPGQITTRQRYEEVHAMPGSSCAVCHQQFDPIGFGFEHYDEGGRYRATEDGLTIDSSDTITPPSGTPLSFTGEEDLVTGLANQPVIHQCFAAYLATYAFGTGDACLGSSNVPQLQSGAIGIADAFAQLAAEPHFTKRNSQ